MLNYKSAEPSLPSKRYLGTDFAEEDHEVEDTEGVFVSDYHYADFGDFAYVLALPPDFRLSEGSLANTVHEFSLIRTAPSGSVVVEIDEVTNPRNELREYFCVLTSEPVLDGFTHVALRILTCYIADRPALTKNMLAKILSDDVRISEAADTLRLLSRLRPYDPQWREGIIRKALQSSSLIVRDAAMQAIEGWAEPGLLEILRQHKEPDALLARYAAQIIVDHGG